jgi:hypothetical protein
MGLFGTNKTVNAHELYPDEYYKHFYFKKSLCDGVELVSKMERTKTKQAAGTLMKAGLSKYMEIKVAEHIQEDLLPGELNLKMKITRFLLILRR